MGKPETRKRDPVSSYLADIRPRRSLSRQEEARLLQEVGTGAHGALGELVESNLGFVIKVANEYRNLGIPFEDLLNEGNLGLLEAARRFDPTKGTRFITYAIWWVRKSILRALSQESRLVRLPYVQLRKMVKVRRAESDLRRSLGRDPSRGDLARHLQLSEREIEALLQARPDVLSLDRPIGREDGGSRVEFLQGVGTTSEQRLIDQEMQSYLGRAFLELSEQQRTVVALRFGLDRERPLTLQAVGERLGLSRERIRQVEARAMKRLRQLLRRQLGPLPDLSRGPERRRRQAPVQARPRSKSTVQHG